MKNSGLGRSGSANTMSKAMVAAIVTAIFTIWARRARSQGHWPSLASDSFSSISTMRTGCSGDQTRPQPLVGVEGEFAQAVEFVRRAPATSMAISGRPNAAIWPWPDPHSDHAFSRKAAMAAAS